MQICVFSVFLGIRWLPFTAAEITATATAAAAVATCDHSAENKQSLQQRYEYHQHPKYRERHDTCYWYVFYTSIITKIHHVHNTQPKQKFKLNIQYCPFLKKHLTKQIHLLNVKGKINLELTNLKPLDSDVINKFMYCYTCIKTSVKKHSFEFLKEKFTNTYFPHLCKIVNIAQNV